MSLPEKPIKQIQPIQVPKVQITSPAHTAKRATESNSNAGGALVTTPRSTKRKSHTPGNNIRPRGAYRPQGDARAVSVITFAGPTRPVATKRDMKQVFFDKD